MYCKKSRGFIPLLLLFCLLFAIITLISFVLQDFGDMASSSDGLSTHQFTVIIDAGHGGEDGGASGVNGVLEKDLNLMIAHLLCEELGKVGVRCVMTRSSDMLLYDRESDYEGRKKLLDMKERLRIASLEKNAVFVSIHQNSYPVEKYSGFQVYYSPNDARSSLLAALFEKAVKGSLQPENNRKAKVSDGKIYILDELYCPAVLLECGFISNQKECELLCTEEYRRRLAAAFCDAIKEYKESFTSQ